MHRTYRTVKGWWSEMKTIKVSYGGFEAEQQIDECLYNAIYNKAIDDFITKCVSCGIVGLSTFHDMNILAEELKAGGENEK